MQPFFDKLAAYPLPNKAGALAGLIVLIFFGYWYFVLGDLQNAQQLAQQHITELQTEKEGYETREREYNQYRNEVADLLEQQKELLRVLPRRDDIEQFIENVQAQIELTGLTKVSSVREAAQPVEMYVKIPVKMSLTGTYHQINHFFKNIGDLKRIVNIENLTMEPVTTAVAMDQPDLLKADFIATTFQFVDKGQGANGQRTGTSISSGGGH
jgi:type IV pilus assembly protein PilO